MTIGSVHRLHNGFGFIVSPGSPRTGSYSFFFHATDVDHPFDDLAEGDAVEFEIVEPAPAKGPRAYAVRRYGR